MTFKGHPESRRTGQYYDGFSGCEYIIDCTIVSPFLFLGLGYQYFPITFTQLNLRTENKEMPKQATKNNLDQPPRTPGRPKATVAKGMSKTVRDRHFRQLDDALAQVKTRMILVFIVSFF